MRDKKIRKIGVLAGNLETPYVRELVRGITDAAASVGDRLFIFPGMYDRAYAGDITLAMDEENDLYSQIFSYALILKLDVVLISVDTIRCFVNPHIIELIKVRLREVGIPCLMLESADYGEPSYRIENVRGIEEGLRHLVRVHHCQRIAFVGGPKGNHGAGIRQAVYEQIMAEYGLVVYPGYLETGDYSFSSGRVAARRILNCQPMVEAICFANDLMALGGYEAIKDAGLRVGRNIAVLGFDDIPEAACVEPPLSTVRASTYAFGFRALERALEVLEGRPLQEKLFPSQFVCRTSCGCNENYYLPRFLPRQSYSQLVRSDQFSMSMARGILQQCAHEEDLLRRMLQTVQGLHLGRVWLYLFDTPQHLKSPLAAASCWQQLRLAGFQRGDGFVVLPREARPFWKDTQNLVPMNQQRVVHFSVFARHEHYGIMVAAASTPEDVSLLFSLSIQMGTALQFIFMEREHQRLLRMLREQSRNFERQAVSDELTGVYNRFGFFKEVRECIRKNAGRPAVLAFADMDHLKEVNDLFGHREGDIALSEVARILRQNFGSQAIIGRIGGDEFVVLSFLDRNEAAVIIQQNIQDIAAQYNAQSDKPYLVEISLGIKQFICTDDIAFSALLKEADDHLYAAKTKRRHSCLRDKWM